MSNCHLFFGCYAVSKKSDDVAYFVRKPVRRILKFVGVLKQGLPSFNN